MPVDRHAWFVLRAHLCVPFKHQQDSIQQAAAAVPDFVRLKNKAPELNVVCLLRVCWVVIVIKVVIFVVFVFILIVIFVVFLVIFIIILLILLVTITPTTSHAHSSGLLVCFVPPPAPLSEVGHKRLLAAAAAVFVPHAVVAKHAEAGKPSPSLLLGFAVFLLAGRGCLHRGLDTKRQATIVSSTCSGLCGIFAASLAAAAAAAAVVVVLGGGWAIVHTAEAAVVKRIHAGGVVVAITVVVVVVAASTTPCMVPASAAAAAALVLATLLVVSITGTVCSAAVLLGLWQEPV